MMGWRGLWALGSGLWALGSGLWALPQLNSTQLNSTQLGLHASVAFRQGGRTGGLSA
jgi:hypothetical protein